MSAGTKDPIVLQARVTELEARIRDIEANSPGAMPAGDLPDPFDAVLYLDAEGNVWEVFGHGMYAPSNAPAEQEAAA